MGNTLNVVNQYDTLGRLSAGFVCAGSTSASCSGGTQAYGFTAQRQGTHVTQSCDTVLNVCNAFGYDEFDRLTSRTVNQGTVQNFTYAYDRYGNRWQQNAPQGGPILNITFNPGNNIINTSGFTNDVVGNVSNDTFHTYTYDPDGNLTAVDGGNTARYYYDSLDQRVQIAPTRGTYEFVWDIFGRRVSNWQAGNHLFVESNAYTDSGPIAIRSGGYRDYETQNWVCTERVRTSYSGAVSLSIASLPWADQHTPSGDNGDQHDFAGMDRDLEDSTEHAQYRQYATNLGRWLSPDQYLASYDFTNPQSFNRYSYALNDPVNYLDPSGLDACGPDEGDATSGVTTTCTVNGDDGGGDTLCWWCTEYGSQTNCWWCGVQPPPPAPPAPPTNQTTTPAPSKSIAGCAAKFASAHSIAGGLQALGIGSDGGVGGFLTNTFGGNTFAALYNLGSTFVSSSSTDQQVLTQMGKAYLRGPLQGIPSSLVGAGGTPFAVSPTGIARGAAVGAAFNAVTGANDSLITLSGEVGLSTVETTAAEFATGVGEAKFALDFLTFAYGVGTCIP